MLAAEFVALMVTGLFLVFGYRPEVSQAWRDVGSTVGVAGVATSVRHLHRVVGHAMVLTALGLFVLAVAASLKRLFGQERSREAWVGGFAVLVLVLAGSFTGYLLPWDQLAMWAVTVGTNYSGYRWLFDDSVRFVLLQGVEIGLSGIRRWFFVHTLLLPGLLGLAMVGMVLHQRSTARRSHVVVASDGYSLGATNDS
jgi:quinol-cytochrome oxidoreductase complex cytochrome b subunit